MPKLRKTITIDPDIWDRVGAEAKRLRMSRSWVTESAIREYLQFDAETRERLADKQPYSVA